MASTPNLVILVSDWLKGCGFQVLYESLMLIGSVMSLIILTGSEEGGNECSKDGPSYVQKIPYFAAQITQQLQVVSCSYLL